MIAIAYIYEFSQTLNNKVNLEKLDLEVRASTLLNYITPPYIYSGNLYLNFESELSEADKLILEGLISAHDGEEANVSENHVQERELKIRELTEMAIYHPALAEIETVEYLTSIDNWFNGWKRSGVNTPLINKIIADANNADHPQYAFLTTAINSQGNKTFEFLISKITE